MFPTGYQANVGTIPALVGPGDVVFSDELNHASIIDGCRLSRAQVVRYAHGDVEALRDAVRRAHGGEGRRLIVTDTVFSHGRRPGAAAGDPRGRPGARLRPDGRRGPRHRRARADRRRRAGALRPRGDGADRHGHAQQGPRRPGRLRGRQPGALRLPAHARAGLRLHHRARAGRRRRGAGGARHRARRARAPGAHPDAGAQAVRGRRRARLRGAADRLGRGAGGDRRVGRGAGGGLGAAQAARAGRRPSGRRRCPRAPRACA